MKNWRRIGTLLLALAVLATFSALGAAEEKGKGDKEAEKQRLLERKRVEQLQLEERIKQQQANEEVKNRIITNIRAKNAVVTQVGDQTKTVTVRTEDGKTITLDGSKLSGLPKVGQIVDIQYAESGGKLTAQSYKLTSGQKGGRDASIDMMGKKPPKPPASGLKEGPR
jgi:hypothetical protein